MRHCRPVADSGSVHDTQADLRNSNSVTGEEVAHVFDFGWTADDSDLFVLSINGDNELVFNLSPNSGKRLAVEQDLRAVAQSSRFRHTQTCEFLWY